MKEDVKTETDAPLAVILQRGVIKKADTLIRKHIQYRESFKEQRRAFSRSWMRNGKEYNHPGMCIMIQEHQKKTAEKILKLSL